MSTILIVEDSDCWKSIVNADFDDQIQKVVLRPQDTMDFSSLNKRIENVTGDLDWVFNNECFLFGSFQVKNSIFSKYNNSDELDKYNCSSYYHYIQDKLLNFEHSLVPIQMLKSLKWHLFKNYAIDTKIFIRPNSGEKSFTGGLFDLQGFDKEVDKILKLQNDGLVLVSSPKEILAEFRFFIRANEIVDYSLYRYQGNVTMVHSAPNDLKEFVRSAAILVDKEKYPLYVLDAAIMKDQSFKIIEMNGYFTSDLYACDGKKIVEAIL